MRMYVQATPSGEHILQKNTCIIDITYVCESLDSSLRWNDMLKHLIIITFYINVGKDQLAKGGKRLLPSPRE